MTTFRVYPFGRPELARTITTKDKWTAVNLAAFHFRVHRSLITVKPV